MRLLKNGFMLALVLSVISGLSVIGAQAPTSKPTSGSDRLFLSFAEDATVIENQWWEVQVGSADFDPADAVVLRGVVAVQPLQDVEFGGSVGFGNTDAPSGLPDGSGATDLDLWGKYYLTVGSDTEFALGGLLTIPTGDDRAGLGADAFSFGVFGSLRHRLPKLIVSVNAGIRLNEDGQIQDVNLDGEESPFLAGGVIFPLSDQVSLVGEAHFEAERFEGRDSDFRILGGINWRASNRGTFRGAAGVGLTDGAPDGQLILGYAYSF